MNMSKIKWLVAGAALLFTLQAKAQNITLSFPGSEATYGDVFTEIEKQGGVWFAYATRDFDTAQKVAIPSGVYSLKGALDRMFAGTPYRYSMDGKHIFIIRKDEPRPHREMYVIPPNRLKTSVNPTAAAPKTEEERWVLVSEGRDSTYKFVDYAGQDKAIKFDARNTAGASARVYEKFPKVAIKTNLLYGLGTLTPNLAVEFGIGRRMTLELSAAYHPWNLKTQSINNKKFVHGIYRPEFRYWLCDRFDGHFFGVHAFYANYNINGYKVPILFEKEYRYEGWAVGAGIAYGYHWAWSKHWGMEFNVGVGFAYLDYGKYDCIRCTRGGEPRQQFYFGPTRLGITLAYIIK